MAIPVVGVPACVKTIDPHPFHVAGDKYVRAIAGGAEALPLVIPSLGDMIDPAEVIPRLDGLLLTGSPSNVEPHRYAGPPSREGTLHDPARDAAIFPLIDAALEAGLPILAICRGIQELNVALGGTLHQEVHHVDGRDDHRADESRPVEEQYGPAHTVRLTKGGHLARLFDAEVITVNSIHSQGIDTLAPGLSVEAVAPDGQVEAVRLDTARGFCLGVQWHPEWRYEENPQSRILFRTFGAAVRAYATARAHASAA
ncbi:MAG: gamma-glutamyl-gamma-aminobutyrate hydrolase family protein [Azospirillaceae bacterium]